MTLTLTIEVSDDAISAVVTDIATSSSVGEGRCPHTAGTPHRSDTSTWLDVAEVACRVALDSISALGLTIHDIRSVHVRAAGIGGGLVALGADDHPVHDALTASHPESAADADWLLSTAAGGTDGWLDATGVLPTAGSTVALLSWLHRSAPDAWAAATRFTTPAGRMLELLGGDPVIGPVDAIGTAALDRHDATTWRTDLLSVVDADRDWAEALPVVISESVPAGLLSSETAALLGLRAATPLHVSPSRPPA